MKKRTITKRAKPVEVTDCVQKINWTRTEYTCPSCYTTFISDHPNKSVLRFICDCGQELRIIKRTTKQVDKWGHDIKATKIDTQAEADGSKERFITQRFIV